MSNVLQSACKQFHSTDTVLLKIQNYITLSIDKGKVAVDVCIYDPLIVISSLNSTVRRPTLLPGRAHGTCRKGSVYDSNA